MQLTSYIWETFAYVTWCSSWCLSETSGRAVREVERTKTAYQQDFASLFIDPHFNALCVSAASKQHNWLKTTLQCKISEFHCKSVSMEGLRGTPSLASLETVISSFYKWIPYFIWRFKNPHLWRILMTFHGGFGNFPGRGGSKGGQHSLPIHANYMYICML